MPLEEPGTGLVGLLDRESRLLLERLRGYPLSALGATLPGAPGTRAVVVRHLAQVLAEAAQGLEQAERATPPAWRHVPDLGGHAVADQLAVTAHDLMAALADPPAVAWSRAGRVPAARLAGVALAEVALHRLDVDAAPPGATVTRAALAALGEAGPDLVTVARRRCTLEGAGGDPSPTPSTR